MSGGSGDGPVHPCRSAGQAGATEEVEQHRLGSIIRSVRDTNVGGQHVIPEAACRGLEVRGRVEVEASVLERHPPRSGESHTNAASAAEEGRMP